MSRGWRVRSIPRARSRRTRCTPSMPGTALRARHGLAEAHARVEELAPALRAHAAKPGPEVVKRRLDALEADIPRRRAWAAEMEADAAQRRRADDEFDWSSLFSRGTNPIRAVFIALAIWFVWYFWPRG